MTSSALATKPWRPGTVDLLHGQARADKEERGSEAGIVRTRGRSKCCGPTKRGERNLLSSGGIGRGLRLGYRGKSGFGGVGELACGFDDLLGEIVCDFGFVAGYGEIGGAEELFLAVAQGVANGLLDLRVVDAAEAGGFASDELQDADAILQNHGLADLAGL